MSPRSSFRISREDVSTSGNVGGGDRRSSVVTLGRREWSRREFFLCAQEELRVPGWAMYDIASAGVRTTWAPWPSDGVVCMTDHDGPWACELEYERWRGRG